MVLCILCCIRILPYDGHITGCYKYFLDFSHCGAGLCLIMTLSVMYTMLFLGHSLNMGLSYIVYGLK